MIKNPDLESIKAKIYSKLNRVMTKSFKNCW